MAGDNTPPTLVNGHRYLVRYRSRTQRRDRTAVMVYVSEDGDRLMFSARPLAGTQPMPPAWVQAIEPRTR